MALLGSQYIIDGSKELVVEKIRASLKEREVELCRKETDKAISRYGEAFLDLSYKLFNLGGLTEIKNFSAPMLQELDRIVFQEVQKILRLRKLAVAAVIGLGLVPLSLIITGIALSTPWISVPLMVIGGIGTVAELSVGLAGFGEMNGHPFKHLVNFFHQIDNNTADNLKI